MAATPQPSVVTPPRGTMVGEEPIGDAYDSFWASAEEMRSLQEDPAVDQPQQLAGKAYQEFLDR